MKKSNSKFIYLVTELNGSVVVFREFSNLDFRPIQNLSTFPPTYKGPFGGADIHISPDGKFLYTSNRGNSNTIAIFSIEAATGKLTSVGHQFTNGIKPRNFNFDPSGNFLLVANQDSGGIVIFKRDKTTGLLTDSGKRINVANPVCIKWIN